jgi:hypothetical protein
MFKAGPSFTLAWNVAWVQLLAWHGERLTARVFVGSPLVVGARYRQVPFSGRCLQNCWLHFWSFVGNCA